MLLIGYEIFVVLLRNQNPVVDGPTLINAAAVRLVPIEQLRVGDKVTEPVVVDEVDFSNCNQFIVRLKDMDPYFSNIGLEWLIEGYFAVHKGLASALEGYDTMMRVNTVQYIMSMNERIERLMEVLDQMTEGGHEFANILYFWKTCW